MKRLLVIVVLLSAAIGMRTIARAESTAEQGKELPGKEISRNCPQEDMDIYRQLCNILKQLSLTEAQQKSIGEIMKAEKGKVEQLQNKIENAWDDLMRISFAAQYNEAQGKVIIDKLFVYSKDELTYHAQMMRDINSQLTASQQEQIQKLIPRNKPRQTRRSGFGWGWGQGWGF